VSFLLPPYVYSKPKLNFPLTRKYFPIRGPEARLFAACGAALLFPTGMFIYAWGANAAIPWIVPVIGVTVRLLRYFFINTVFVLYPSPASPPLGFFLIVSMG
jgi:hypothetical protein